MFSWQYFWRLDISKARLACSLTGRKARMAFCEVVMQGRAAVDNTSSFKEELEFFLLLQNTHDDNRPYARAAVRTSSISS